MRFDEEKKNTQQQTLLLADLPADKQQPDTFDSERKLLCPSPPPDLNSKVFGERECRRV